MIKELSERKDAEWEEAKNDLVIALDNTASNASSYHILLNALNHMTSKIFERLSR